MPFGLDTKSLAIGIVLAWFVIPFIMARLGGARKQTVA